MKNLLDLVMNFFRNHWEKVLCVTIGFVVVMVLAMGWLGTQAETRNHDNNRSPTTGKKILSAEQHDVTTKLEKLDKPTAWNWKKDDSRRLFSPNFTAKVATVNGIPKLGIEVVATSGPEDKIVRDGPSKKVFKFVEDALIISELKNEPFKLRFKGEQVIGDKKTYQINFLGLNKTKIAAIGDVIDGFKLLEYRVLKDAKGKEVSELDVQRPDKPIVHLVYNQDVYAGDEPVAFIKNRSLPNPTYASTAYMYRKGLKIIVATDIEKPDKTMGKLNVELEITEIDLESGTLTAPETAPPNTIHKIKWNKVEKKPDAIPGAETK